MLLPMTKNLVSLKDRLNGGVLSQMLKTMRLVQAPSGGKVAVFLSIGDISGDDIFKYSH